ncbi:MAG TPA: GNAT family N-acetyltransferase [Methylomirabilota bacterium]|nr:GNAT family N-acetyltransferase [Methylomirabilota bacterium]
MEWTRGEYVCSDDKLRLDLDFIYQQLQATYWAANRSRELIEKSVQHSVCFGLFHRGQQVGLARVITDYATFAYLGDLIIAAEHRGHGLGKWLVECVLAHPSMQTTTQCLRTRDAHSLYERFGFERTEYLRRSSNDWSKAAASQ